MDAEAAALQAGIGVSVYLDTFDGSTWIVNWTTRGTAPASHGSRRGPRLYRSHGNKCVQMPWPQAPEVEIDQLIPFVLDRMAGLPRTATCR